MIEYKAILEKYKSYNSNFKENLIEKALSFAVKFHGDQLRASKIPYFFHSIEVAEIIVQMNLDNTSIITAILHDTVEDTKLTLLDIEQNFGLEVAKLVDGVTKLKKLKFASENLKQAENFRKLLLSMSGDIRILLVKLADRLHNMRTLHFIESEQKRRSIAAETMEIYAPIAERIGIKHIKAELQDICFKILSPEIRKKVLEKTNLTQKKEPNFINSVISKISTLIESKGIKNIRMQGRAKSPYSIWTKSQRKNIDLDKISDILAFRIMVDSIDDCYKILGILHQNYKTVPNSFKDFISIPKNNGYQSLHTNIVYPPTHTIEVQIRTHYMHKIAELGIAAHWQYKQNYTNAVEGANYSWIQDLLSILKNNRDPVEFFKNTKLSMYYDQIFCFTPKGKIIILPRNATIVDFAYAISDIIGNHCIGATVDGEPAPLRQILNTGNVVEIRTSPKHYISTSCEKFVVTGYARSAIRNIQKFKERMKSISLGKGELVTRLNERDIKNIDHALKIISKNYNSEINHICYLIGRKIIDVDYLIERFLDTSLSIVYPFNLKIQKDLPNILYQDTTLNNQCCSPRIGEEVVGFLNNTKNVFLHNRYCKIVKNCIFIPKISILPNWDNYNVVPILTRFTIHIKNDISKFGSLSAHLKRYKSRILNISIINNSDREVEIILDILSCGIGFAIKMGEILSFFPLITNIRQNFLGTDITSTNKLQINDSWHRN